MSIPANIRPDQIPAAIEDAEQAMLDDWDNENIPYEVFKARKTALDAAIEFWQIPSVTGAVANLRVFWSV